MLKTPKVKLSADAIAEKASRGEDISFAFAKEFVVVKPVQHQKTRIDGSKPLIPSRKNLS